MTRSNYEVAVTGDEVRVEIDHHTTYDCRELPGERWATVIDGRDTQPWRACARGTGDPIPPTVAADTVHELAERITAQIEDRTGQLVQTETVAQIARAIAWGATQIDRDDQHQEPEPGDEPGCPECGPDVCYGDDYHGHDAHHCGLGRCPAEHACPYLVAQ